MKVATAWKARNILVRGSTVIRPLHHLVFRMAGGGSRLDFSRVGLDESHQTFDTHKAGPSDAMAFYPAVSNPFVNQCPACADILGGLAGTEVAGWYRVLRIG